MKDTKQKILTAATELIERNGVKNTSLRDVAAECEMSLGTITYHFPNREQLLFAVMTQRLDARDIRLASCFSHEDKEERYKALVQYFRSVKQSIKFQELYNYLMFASLSTDSVLREDMTNLFIHWKSSYATFLPGQVSKESRKDYAYFLQLFINANHGNFHNISCGSLNR